MKKGRIVLPRIIVALGFVALLAPLAFVGCAPQQHWTKTGLNQAEFDQDAARCRREAAKATYPNPFAADGGQEHGLERSVAQHNLFEQCMFAKGYRLERPTPGK